MRLTKKKAVQITKELWEWLAETGEDKEAWPKWEEYGEFDSNCALCERTKRLGRDCGDCPLLGMWTPTPESICLDDFTPYALWEDTFYDVQCEANTKARKQYARQIVDLCDRWLKEHHG